MVTLDDVPADVDPILFKHLLYRPLARLALTNSAWAQRALPMVIVPSHSFASAEEMIASAHSFEELDAVVQLIARHCYIELVHFDLDDFRFPRAERSFLTVRNGYGDSMFGHGWGTYAWRDTDTGQTVNHELHKLGSYPIRDLTSMTEMFAAAKRVILSCVRLRFTPSQGTDFQTDLSDQLSQLLVATTVRLPPLDFLQVCQPWFKPFDLMRSCITQTYRHQIHSITTNTPYDVALALAKNLRRDQWTPDQLAQLIVIGLTSHHTEYWSEPSMIATLLNREFPPSDFAASRVISEETLAVLQLARPAHALTSQSVWFHFICSDVTARCQRGEPRKIPIVVLLDSAGRLNVEPLVAHAATLPLPSFYRLIEVAVEEQQQYVDAVSEGEGWQEDICSGPEECFHAFLRAFIAEWAGEVSFPSAFSHSEQANVCEMLASKLPEEAVDLLGRDALAWIRNANCSKTTAIISDALARG